MGRGFDSVFDVGGNIPQISFAGGVFTMPGVPPTIPDSVIEDLLALLEESGELNAEIGDNISKAEAVLQELLDEQAAEDSTLICS